MSLNLKEQYNNTDHCKVKTTVKRLLKAVHDVIKSTNFNKQIYSGTVNRLLFTAHKVDNFGFSTEYLGQLTKKLVLLEQMYGVNFKIAVASVKDMTTKMNYDKLRDSLPNTSDNDVMLWVVCWNKGELSFETN